MSRTLPELIAVLRTRDFTEDERAAIRASRDRLIEAVQKSASILPPSSDLAKLIAKYGRRS